MFWFWEKSGILGSNSPILGRKKAAVLWGQRHVLGEKMVCGGENITGRKVDGPCILAEMDEGEVLCPENPVGTDLASPKCRRGWQVSSPKGISTPKCHLVSRHFDGSAPTCHFSPRKTTCSPPHTSVLQAYAISSPQAPCLRKIRHFSRKLAAFSPKYSTCSPKRALLFPEI